MGSLNSLKTKSSLSGATILNAPVYTLGGDAIRIKDSVHDSAPEIHTDLSSTNYTAKNMKDSVTFLVNSFINDLGYTGFGVEKSKRKNFLSSRFT